MLANCFVWPQRLVSKHRCCPSSLAPRLNMRLFACLQIALLLTTSILPEGKILLSQAQVCNDGECGCSAESRQNGTCCCSTKKERGERDSECRSGQSGDEATADNSASVCCSKESLTGKPSENSSETCCSTKPSPASRCDKATDVLMSAVSGCSCGGDSPVVWVCHMPRTLPVRIPSPALALTQEVNVLVDDQRQPKVDEPPTPPPDDRVC